jgi:molybdopterin synthase catalytic subunit
MKSPSSPLSPGDKGAFTPFWLLLHSLCLQGILTLSIQIALIAEDFSAPAHLAAFQRQIHTPNCPAISGAVASFIGQMRAYNSAGQRLLSMDIEHYPGMSERALEDIAHLAVQRWQLHAVNITHRIGHILPGQDIVLLAVMSAHRREAFTACQALMDWLKSRAPFWKYEATEDGGNWVTARPEDEEDALFWEKAGQ